MRARMSPLKLTQSLDDDEIARLYEATHATLGLDRSAARSEAGGVFRRR